MHQGSEKWHLVLEMALDNSCFDLFLPGGRGEEEAASRRKRRGGAGALSDCRPFVWRGRMQDGMKGKACKSRYLHFHWVTDAGVLSGDLEWDGSRRGDAKRGVRQGGVKKVWDIFSNFLLRLYACFKRMGLNIREVHRENKGSTSEK